MEYFALAGRRGCARKRRPDPAQHEQDHRRVGAHCRQRPDRLGEDAQTDDRYGAVEVGNEVEAGERLGSRFLQCDAVHGGKRPVEQGAAAEPATDKRDKKDKRDKEKRGQTGPSWQLAAGELPGDEGDDIAKKPSAAIAIAQYAVLVVGLVMVLIGVVVMVANSHVT